MVSHFEVRMGSGVVTFCYIALVFLYLLEQSEEKKRRAVLKHTVWGSSVFQKTLARNYACVSEHDHFACLFKTVAEAGVEPTMFRL